ncbi:MAG: PHP domain-containing protein [Gammaproteobacteria bacterium]|nr:PHP domain-containing protein [Gammaproteobacteria bacterium]
MSLCYDLHAHSTFSDGTLSPEDLVARAQEKGVNVLALTDHDTVAGVARAQAAAKEQGIELIPGVEISVSWRNTTIHIVGLNVDPFNERLLAGLDSLRQLRELRAQRIAHKLEKQGFENALADTIALAGCEAVTRTHFARLIIARGRESDMESVFKKWLGRKGKAYVAGEWASLPDALDWIQQAGGQAVIAHPARYDMTNTKLGELIADFKQHGGVAMEVASSSHNVAEKARMAGCARRHDLLASVGSDFHSPGNPRIELGAYLQLPEGTEPVWRDWSLSH